MPSPKYRPGQIVYYEPPAWHSSGIRGAYVVVQQMPEQNGEFEYRIKHPNEVNQRVARENELRKPE